MFIPLFRDWKIRTKLISVTLFVVLVPLLCVAFLSMDRFGKALKNASDEDLEHLVRSVYSMCKVHQEEVQRCLSLSFSTKPVGKGTGLGLSLCFGIIETHGGRLEIESQHGNGTEVKVLLPAKETGKE